MLLVKETLPTGRHPEQKRGPSHSGLIPKSSITNSSRIRHCVIVQYRTIDQSTLGGKDFRGIGCRTQSGKSSRNV